MCTRACLSKVAQQLRGRARLYPQPSGPRVHSAPPPLTALPGKEPFAEEELSHNHRNTGNCHQGRQTESKATVTLTSLRDGPARWRLHMARLRRTRSPARLDIHPSRLLEKHIHKQSDCPQTLTPVSHRTDTLLCITLAWEKLRRKREGGGEDREPFRRGAASGGLARDVPLVLDTCPASTGSDRQTVTSV